MVRTEINAKTGEVKQVSLTDAEVDEIMTARAKPKRPAPPAPITAAQLFAALKAKGILTDEDVK